MSEQIKNEFYIKKEHNEINMKEGTFHLPEGIKVENDMEVNWDFKLEIKEEPLKSELVEEDFELISDIDVKEEPFESGVESFSEQVCIFWNSIVIYFVFYCSNFNVKKKNI